MILFFLTLMFAGSLTALVLNILLSPRPVLAARWGGYFVGMSFLSALMLLGLLPSSDEVISVLSLRIHHLSVLLSCLVLLVSFVVHRFSLRYLMGDRLYSSFFVRLSVLTLSVMLMVLTDNLFVCWAAWSCSNWCLVSLMVHKKDWCAAKNSGKLALATLASGSLCLLISFLCLTNSFATTSMFQVSQQLTTQTTQVSIAMSLMLLAAVIQSGLFPFHRWILSSLNSPTPVSALMHAGIVNAGGMLLVKFSALWSSYPGLLDILFLFGAVSALLGTTWKLMQHDIKKMLACSTIAQMGFMMMQCGVGLFSSAIAHICWHGLFKAYLFLSSGSAVTQKKPTAISASKAPWLFLVSLSGGFLAMVIFAWVTNKPVFSTQNTSFVLLFAFIAGAQLMFTWLAIYPTALGWFWGSGLSVFSGLVYGSSIRLIDGMLPNLSHDSFGTLSLLHWGVMALFVAFWILFNLEPFKKFTHARFGGWLYVTLFNASQPPAQTWTALRTDYTY